MSDSDASSRHPFLDSLGERVRLLRARRGLTRRAVAQAAQVSERHLANLEGGTGNASILILLQVAQALGCSLSELLGDVTTSSPEWLLLRQALAHRSEPELQKVRLALPDLLHEQADHSQRNRHIALIGLRGAGKSSLGRLLAQTLGWPFVELTQRVEALAGCGTSEIHSLYGPLAYRRYERRALEEALETLPEAVIATPGGLVSDTDNFQHLLAHCLTVWLQATPEDHMGRVLAQGDTRPMAANPEAMDDLRRILDGRAAFYAKADLSLMTSGQSVQQAYQALLALLAPRLA